MSASVDIVRKFCDLMEKRDAEALRPLIADDAVYQNVGMPRRASLQTCCGRTADGRLKNTC